MAQAPAFDPDGSPNAALNAYRRRAILARKDRGQITKHFNLREFSCHDGSYVPSRAHGAIDRLATAYLEPLRAKFGACTVLSGYRHRAYNRRIGGAIHSQHIYDVTPDTVAADVRFARGNPKQWAAYARELRRKYKKGGGIGVYIASDFLHCDNRHYTADWSG
jgi:Peptidase M15